MKTTSLEWQALEYADRLLMSCKDQLYVGDGWTRHLPYDGTTQTAHGILCHTHRLHEGIMREYLTNHSYDKY